MTPDQSQFAKEMLCYKLQKYILGQLRTLQEYYHHEVTFKEQVDHMCDGMEHVVRHKEKKERKKAHKEQSMEIRESQGVQQQRQPPEQPGKKAEKAQKAKQKQQRISRD